MEGDILIVDDDARILFSTRRLFDIHGYNIDTAANWVEAINKIKGKDYDLIILDIMMPDVTGTNLYEAIKRKRPDTKVMYLTATAETKDIRKQVEAGEVYFMQKPYDPEGLIYNVGRIIKEKK